MMSIGTHRELIGHRDDDAGGANSQSLELDELYRTARVGLGLLDGELRYLRLNQALAEIDGLSIAAHIGMHAGDIDSEIVKSLAPMMAAVLTSGQPLLNLEMSRKTPVDVMNQRTWMVDLHPVALDNAVGIRVVSQDITKQKQAYVTLLRSNEELRQFAFAAAHDMQEPLRNIGLYAEMLSSRYQPEVDAEVDELTIVIESARRMQGLLKDLLVFSEVIQVHDEQSQAVDCNEVCRSALEILTLAVRESGAEVSIASLPTVIAGRAHMVLLLQNLIGNALKFRGAGRPTRIHVAAQRRDDHWVLSVSDNGIGIAPEYHDRIFGIFKRLHGRDVPGTGIGLAICKRIVDHHSGQLWLESQLGVGSTFYFSLTDSH